MTEYKFGEKDHEVCVKDGVITVRERVAGRWRAEAGGQYEYVTDRGVTHEKQEIGSISDNHRWQRFNHFKPNTGQALDAANSLKVMRVLAYVHSVVAPGESGPWYPRFNGGEWHTFGEPMGYTWPASYPSHESCQAACDLLNGEGVRL